ncbi:Monothiol glutaredoxin-S6 [Heracleum sosnowskyi]|uniref:Monothiol glutaredoxin-S6 n=1 Tax=Heracleum sosnowskyi TaxID=360622 RepID=A0AAD8IFZ3_9APIA|nr:Monothiol glutaredoxin-S6 [Heracleum sosnowskyi]
MALVTRLGSEYPVVIFSKSSCSMSHSIKTLLSSFGANLRIYEIDEDSNGQQMEMELKALGRKPSVPAVFIGQQLIGGSNEIFSLHLKGKLVPLLLNANAIWL